MKHSSSSNAPLSGEVHWQDRQDLTRDFAMAPILEAAMPFCNLDSIAATCHCAPVCTIHKRLKGFDASEQAYGLDGLRECSLPENDPGYVPIANRSAESCAIYSRSTTSNNFIRGSSRLLLVVKTIGSVDIEDVDSRNIMRKKTIGILATGVALCALCAVSDNSAFAARGHGGHGAGGVPELNVEQVCKGIAQQGGVTFRDPAIAAEKKKCIESEKEVRDELVKQWSKFVPDDKTHCVNESVMGGESSYTELLTCLEMARDVRAYHAQEGAAANTDRPSVSADRPPGRRPPR
jgi:hypothetical protein